MIQNQQQPIATTQALNATGALLGPFLVTGADGFYIQGVITGTPTGTLKLQRSGDNPTLAAASVANFTDVPSSSLSISAAGNFDWNIDRVSYNWVQIYYTDGSSGASTATLAATMSVKKAGR